MALSGSFTGTTSNDYIKPKITWSATQSQSGNYSNVTATLTYSRTNSGYTTSGTWSGSITINGTKTTATKVIEITQNSNTKTISATVKVPHNSDGTKSIKISATGSISGTTLSSTSISSTITLTTIPRASSITSASNTTLGNPCSIKWTPNAKSFYYKVKLVLGDWSWTSDALHPNTTSAYTYETPNLSLSVANQLPSATSGTMTAYLYTYSNSACSTKIGSTASKTFTVYIPSSMIPKIDSMSVSVVNSNDIISGWGLYVKGYSKAKISCSSSGSYKSTISSYVLSGGYSATPTSMPYTGGTLSSSGTITFNCVAKDSRGRSSDSVSKSITVYNYYSPSISSFSVERNASNATKIIAKVNYSYASVNSKNSATATLYYKKSTSSSWTTYGTIANNTSVTLNKTFDETVSYNFKVVVKDSLSKTAQDEGFVSTMQVLIDFRAGGKGLGIGKITESDSLEVAFDAKFYENVDFNKDANFNGNVMINGIRANNNKRLWSGGMYMLASQTATLNEKVSSQPNGIVLVFSRYSDGVAQNYNFNTFFIPKHQISTYDGAGYFFFMGTSPTLSLVGCKYLYIYDDKIVGHEDNNNDGTGSGITYDNGSFVLRYVIGV